MLKINQNNLSKINIKISATENYTVLGKRGFGKTTFAKNIISKIKKYKPVIIFDVLNEYDGDFIFFNIKEFYEYGSEHGFRKKIYVCAFKTDDEYVQLFYYLKQLSGIYIIVEEASLFCSSAYIDDNFSDIIKYGRHSDLNYLAIARLPKELNRLILTQSNYIISFRQSHFRDCQYLENFGFDERLSKLNTHEYLIVEV